MNCPIFDSHIHLNHPDFEGQTDQLWNEARQVQIRRALVVGYDLASSRRAIELAERLPGLYASVGVSPHDVMKVSEGYPADIESMAAHPKVVAIGECGLEYFYPVGPREKQIEHFSIQIELARRLDKPVVIHLRDADEDFLRILNTRPPHSAILHCFTASEQVMRKAIELGFYISFSGIVTFKKSNEVKEIASKVPLEHLLVETDAPYLAPAPYRGKQCEPRMIVETCKALAEIKAVDYETLIVATSENAKKVFRIID